MWVHKSKTQNLTISFMFKKKKDELNNSKLKEKKEERILSNS